MTEAPPLAASVAAHPGLSPRLLHFTAMALGASLHLASTINLAGTSLRIGLADLLLPLILLLIIFDRLHHKQSLPAPRLVHCWWWLAALSGWMIVAIVTGRFYAGSWQIWGLANKGVGWFVLVGYFIAGWWLSGHGTAPRISFLRAFFVMGWLASAFSLFLFLLALYQVPFVLAVNYDRATGFLANPNAFGIAIAAQLALQLPLMQRRLVFPNWLHAIGMAFALLALLYSGSRSAWLGFAVAFLVLLIIRRIPWRGLFLAIALAIGINGLTIDLPRLIPQATALFPPMAALFGVDQGAQPNTLKPYRYVTRSNMLADPASQQRVISTKLAVEYWRDRPLRGIGLGSFLWRRGQTDDPTAGTGIHATALWLATETGLVGLALFSAFFIATIKALVWRNGRLEADPIPIGVATVLITLAAASLGTEILYQRYLWVLGGIGLAVAFGPLVKLTPPVTRSSPMTPPNR